MLYRHWKKAALALTSIFWASCNDNESTNPVYQPDTNVTESSSSDIAESSSSKTVKSSSSKRHEKSSSSIAETSSSDTEFSSSSKAIKSSSSKRHEKSSSSIAETSSSDTESSSSSETIESSSSNIAESSSSGKIDFEKCPPSEEKECFSQIIYTQEAAVSDANRLAEHDARYQIEEFVQGKYNLDTYRLEEANVPQCLKDMIDTLERIVPMYGVPLCLPKEYVCEDGTVIPDDMYLKLKAEDEEQKKLEPAYRETYDKLLKKRTAELKQDLDNCFNSIE